MGFQNSAGFRVSCLALLVVGSLAAVAPIDDDNDAVYAKKMTDNFTELTSKLSSIYAQFSDAVSVNLEEEVLQKAWDATNNDKDWHCYETYNKVVRPANIGKKKALKTDIDAAGRAWSRAQDASLKVPGIIPPWGDKEGKARVEKTIRALSGVFRKLDDKGTVEPKKLAAFWKAVQDFASGIPGCLPPADAEAMVPNSVTVRCLGAQVSIH